MVGVLLSIITFIVSLLFFLKLLSWPIWVSLSVAFLPSLIVFMLIGRFVGKKAQALMLTATNFTKRGQMDKAINVLKEGLRLKFFHPLVGSQIYAYLGMLYYYEKNWNEALGCLTKVRISHWNPKVMKAMIYFRKRKINEMEQTFKKLLFFFKKEPFVYAIYAWALQKSGRQDKALKVLKRGIKALKKDDRLERAIENINDGKPIKMSKYGELWYQFAFERPPAQPHPLTKRRHYN